jgi:hypothetical protein
MPLTFLEAIPREIRDQIYTYVLASSTGALTLKPWSGVIAKSLNNLLRTCKQIRRECKDIIWHHSGLSITSHEPTQLYQKFDAEINQRGRICLRRHMTIYLELLDRDELEWMAASLAPLRNLCLLGRLEMITLVASADRPTCLKEFMEYIDLRINGRPLDGRLYRDSAMDPSNHLQLIMNTGWPNFSPWSKQKWLRSLLSDPSGANVLLKEIHDIFGGELYINGKLLLQEHVQKMELINFDTRNGEIKIVPRITSCR